MKKNSPIRIGIVLTPLSEANLKLASQIGVTDVIGRYPGTEPDALLRLKNQIENHGMKLSIVEGYLPMEKIKLGHPGRDEEIELMKKLIQNMGKLGIPTVCYNFMPYQDWTRTSFRVVERGGALTSEFDMTKLTSGNATVTNPPKNHEALWMNLKYFLERILPVAEKAGVKLAMHPDDPPMAKLHGLPQIMSDVPSFERLVQTVDSPSNGVCFCGGVFSSMGVDVPASIRRLGPKIVYAHFRDVRGSVPHFVESFHDNGQTDMAEAMRAYRDIGFSGVMRPDHVPYLEGDKGDPTGYTMLGRLFAVGYMRGLIHATN